MIVFLTFAVFEFDEPKKKRGGTNLHAPTSDCETCGGDRMVVYSSVPNVTSGWMQKRGLKASGYSEQYVPCPDCNPDANTKRHDYASPSNDRVRERLARQ